MKFINHIILVFLLCINTVFSLYEGQSPVKLLNQETFQKMLKSKSIWFVEFFSPSCGHCVAAAPEFQKGAKLLEGIIFFGAVDMTKYPSLGSKYNIRGYPTFKFFGDNKNSPLDFNSERKAEEFVQYSLTQTKQLINNRANAGSGGQKKGKQQSKEKSGSKSGSNSKSNVIVLDDSNFEQQVLKSQQAWFVEFYSPSCGHCISLQPEWQKLPGIMKDKVKIAKLDATVNRNMASKFEIKGYPTIFFFPKGPNKQKINYEGQRTAEQMSNWLNTQSIGEQKRQFLELSQQTFDIQCGKSNVCLLFMLKNKSDLKELNFIESIIQNHIKQPIHYLYTTKPLNQLENDLLINDRDYPKMIAISTSLNSYRIYNSEIKENNIEEFLGKIFGKRGWIRFQKKVDKYLNPTNSEL